MTSVILVMDFFVFFLNCKEGSNYLGEMLFLHYWPIDAASFSIENIYTVSTFVFLCLRFPKRIFHIVEGPTVSHIVEGPTVLFHGKMSLKLVKNKVWRFQCFGLGKINFSATKKYMPIKWPTVAWILSVKYDIHFRPSIKR